MTGQDGEGPKNVISALAAVQRDIGGIEKSKGKGGGLQYAFRGIDAVSAATQPLFGKYGIVISPEVEHHVVDQITVNGKPWVDATLTVAWSVYGPGGVEDKIVARTIGMGRDNSDKAYPKALTQAYKNLILRLLTIGDPQDETDGHTHERDIDRAAKPAVTRSKPSNDQPSVVRPAGQISSAQLKALQTRYSAMERPERLALWSERVGRPVESANDLSKADAILLLTDDEMGDHV